MTFSILYNTVVLFFLCCSFVVVVIVVENIFFHSAYSDFCFSPVLKDIGLIFFGNNYAIFCRSQIIISSFTKEIILWFWVDDLCYISSYCWLFPVFSTPKCSCIWIIVLVEQKSMYIFAGCIAPVCKNDQLIWISNMQCYCPFEGECSLGELSFTRPHSGLSSQTLLDFIISSKVGNLSRVKKIGNLF